MALRRLATGTWGPAASALRCSCSGAGTPAAAPSRFLATVRNQTKKQHKNRTLKEAAADEEALIMKEVDKVLETLSHHAKDMDKLGSELRRVTKIWAVSCIGVSAYAFFWRWAHGEFTQPAAQGTSH
ncbi:unnamed protein product [Urochloa decumbens]|uniref:Uncharacterized protein n=1 Tax=Urochloa decumbens TaxID=240449 RepID=A0ABC8VVK7_9POAL